VTKHAQHAYMPMLQTAEFVARKYAISREAQDAYALSSQQRTARAQAEGTPRRRDRSDRGNDGDRRQGDERRFSYREVTLARDEGNRPETTLASLQALAPVVDGGTVTAGNASQLSDGASACVLMEAKLAERPRSRAARSLPRDDCRRQRARGNGHRADLCRCRGSSRSTALRSATSACGS
jgi:acetyl-CoA acetyltransferase